MKCSLACSLLLTVAMANASIAQTTPAPADNQAATQSKQDAKQTKTKPSATKTPTTKTPKSGASKKSTAGEDAAYASAYKAGATDQNKGTAPK
jgi:hypothetical protein